MSEGQQNFKTLVIGASTNESRFSYLAIKSLVKNNVEVVAIGKRTGVVEGIKIETEPKHFDNIHTVSLYLNPSNQEPYIYYIIGLKPKRIIFNPGTENSKLVELARTNNIEYIFGCTLVMLSTKNYFE